MCSTSPACQHGTGLPKANVIGEIFRSYGERYMEDYRANFFERKLITSMSRCRTSTLGALVRVCKSCGTQEWFYKSCGDSKCPICQSVKRLQCQDRIMEKQLHVPYVHVTFTLPHELNSLLKRNSRELYNLLYRSAWQTVKKLCATESNVGGLPGMIALLHTWGSDLKYHVHLHSLITFGGLDDSGKWVYPKRSSKLARYRDMNRCFRDHFMKGLDKLLASGKLRSVSMQSELLSSVRKKNWVVHNGQPQLDTQVMSEYLSRYVMKIAVSNSRLRFDEAQEQVYMIYNDYRHQKAGEAAPKAVKSFDPLSFIHQFLQHLPPKGFRRLRYYGLHASRTYHRIKDQLPAKLKQNGSTVRTLMQIVRAMLGVEKIECPACQSSDFDWELVAPDGMIVSVSTSPFDQRGPPTVVGHINECISQSPPLLPGVAMSPNVIKRPPSA